jgi:hypothetical protein
MLKVNPYHERTREKVKSKGLRVLILKCTMIVMLVDAIVGIQLSGRGVPYAHFDVHQVQFQGLEEVLREDGDAPNGGPGPDEAELEV